MGRPTRLSTRLLLALVPTVALIMILYAVWAVEQRERSLAEQARGEVRAYSDAVGVAFEHAFRDLQFRDVQEILNEVSRQPQVYGVVVYDTVGEAVMWSEGLEAADAASAAEVRAVARAGGTRDAERAITGEDVFTVLRPIRDSEGRLTGVLEVLQPLSFVAAERSRTRQRFLLNTLTLVVAVTGLTVGLLHRLVDEPLQRFLDVIRGVGAGDLGRRVGESASSRELAEVGREFDRMAASLQTARGQLVSEAEERLALEKQVREQQRLASMGTLAAGVAHQISAPLNVIDGRTRLLLDHGAGPAETERNLRVILEQTERITRIVRALLGFARRPEPRIGTVDVPRVARAASRRVAGAAREGSVTYELDVRDAIRARGDPDLLEEVLVILLDNAVEAVREGGGGRVGIRAWQADDRVGIEVHDDGPGVSAVDGPRVFEAFFTTKPGGTGLGLAIARDLVERMGGDIDLRTNGETVATIRLPSTTRDTEGARA